MVGKTPRVRKNEQQRFEIIAKHCGCLPCLLMGYLDVHTSIEHVTERGRRMGVDSEQHEHTIGLCIWHHFGFRNGRRTRQLMIVEFGPSLAMGRQPFEEHFGDESKVLIPVQNFELDLFAERPWPEHNIDRTTARLVRDKWIELNHAKPQKRKRYSARRI